MPLEPGNACPPTIFADNRMIVFEKPTGLLSVPGIGPEKADCLASRAEAAFPGARIVHRLDRDTSGLIVMARDSEAHRELSRQFQDREVDKTYEAIAAGLVAIDEGTIDAPIRKDMDNPPRQLIDDVHGRPSITRWRVVDRLEDRTRLQLHPLTGRSHQLRLHLLSIGHPILGDDLYAPDEFRKAAPRLMLHATMLGLAHPTSGKSMIFESPCPF
ncbi:MAG: RluA family pseudouridine synthase [Planctomycetota bacterium]|nr:RluA family pseudouridine synthase [Planctomycetota bacterium]